MRQSKIDDTLGHAERSQAQLLINKFTKDTKFWSNSFVSDPGSNNSGFYELKVFF